MLIIYTTPGCLSCRKAKQWLKDKQIDFVEKNMFSTLLNEKEIRNLLMRSENGSDDIISKNSKIIKESNINIDEMRLSELVKFIQENPSILKRPIIIDEKNMLVGYDKDDMSLFNKGPIKTYKEKNCQRDCINYPYCEQSRESK